MLSAGLLIGSSGGAIAAADTDTGNESQASSSQNAQDQSAGKPANGPSDRRADSLEKAIRVAMHGVTVTGTLGSIRSQLQQRSRITNRPKTPRELPDTDAPVSTGDSGAAVLDYVAVGTDAEGPSPTTDPVEPATTDAASSPATQVPASGPVATTPNPGPVQPASSGSRTVPGTRPPLINSFEPAVKVVTSVANVTTSVGTAVASVPTLVLSLPSSPTPIYDVITSLQVMLTSVATSALPLTGVPADIIALLRATGAAPVATVGSAHPGLPSPVLQLLQPPQISTVSALSDRAAVQPPGSGTLGVRMPDVAAAPISFRQEPTALVSTVESTQTHSAVPSLIKGAATALLISVSLWALFTAALPGMGGLAAIGATGVRIGYRQAKAGTALRTTELARFAAAGPIGVVRSDSLIAIRPRALRGTRPAATSSPWRSEMRTLQRVARPADLNRSDRPPQPG